MKWKSATFASLAMLCAAICLFAATPDAPDYPTQSAHLSEVTGTNYEQLPPIEGDLLLRWDFSTEKTYSYNLTQVADSSSSFSGADTDAPTRITSEGVIDIKSQTDGTAKVVLRDLTITMNGWGEGDSEESFTHRSQPVVVQGMQEDGSVASGKAESDTLFRLIFPLPDSALGVNDSTTIPFMFPVNVLGSPLEAQGSVSVTFSGLVYVRGHQCAQLDSQIEVQDVELPEEITATFHIGISGRGRYYFDIDEHRLLEATIAFVTSMDTSFQTPEGFESSGDQNSAISEMSMFSDTLIRLTSD